MRELLNLPLLVIILITLTFSSCEKDEVETSLTKFEQDYVDQINDHRASLGLSPYEIDFYLVQQARNYCMQACKQYSGKEYDYVDYRRAIIEYIGEAERVMVTASGGGSADQIIEVWLGGCSYNKSAIEGEDFKHVGVGVFKYDDTRFFHAVIAYE